MEDWQVDFEWLRVRTYVQESLGLDKLPDLQGVLFLIGIQEWGRVQDDFTKEEKQDLMHVAVCTLLSQDGYYEPEGRDGDGWLHFRQVAPLPYTDLKSQEMWLKRKVIQYFDELNA